MLELSPPQSKEAQAIIAALLPAHAWGERAVTAFVRRLRRNRYPLLALEAAARQHPLLSRSVAWQSALAVDESNLHEQRREFLDVKRAWAAAGIPSVLFKSGGVAPSFPYTSDNVDVLVPRNRTLEARRILLDMGYVWLRNIDEAQKWLFRKFRGGRSVSAVHVHGWVGWDAEFHERAIWDGVRQSADDPEVMVPSPEDALLINTAHALYENKEFRLYDLEKVRAQWKDPLDWEYIEGVACRRGWLDGLYFALLVCHKLERSLFGYSTVAPQLVRRWRNGLRAYGLQWRYWKRVEGREVEFPFRVSFAFSKLVYYKKLLRDSHDGARARAANVVRTLAWGLKQKSGVRPQPGCLIAISGLDGAGKSAHARALSQAFTTAEVLNRVVWSRPGCSALYRAVSRLARRALPEVARSAAPGLDAGDAPNRAAAARKRRLFHGAWAWLNALDLVLLYQVRVRLPLLTGKVVICDRYTYDAAVEIAHRLGASSPLSVPANRFLLALAPRPHAVVWLDVPPECAAARSRDHEDRRDLARQRQLYAALPGIVPLDATMSFADVNDFIVREILQGYENGFPTFTNGLFLSNPDQLNPGEAELR